MTNTKFSRQREAIKEFLMGRKDHPSADVIYKGVRQKYPNISLGTVYRNLTFLSEKGEIRRLRFNDGVDHYDADLHEHYHFICTSCNSVLDIPMKVAEDQKLDENANFGFDGKISGHVTYFEGICPSCLNKAKKD